MMFDRWASVATNFAQNGLRALLDLALRVADALLDRVPRLLALEIALGLAELFGLLDVVRFVDVRILDVDEEQELEHVRKHRRV